MKAREMMLGLRDEFEYLECEGCGCLQLVDGPQDLSRYYPSEYYSLAPVQSGALKRFLKRARARHALGARSPLGALLVRRWGIPPFVTWIRSAPLDWDAPVLDVGSGSGQALRDMRDAGFTSLLGIDPYLPEERIDESGVRLLRTSLSEVKGAFQLVMMNHSLEHMEDPESALRDVARLLTAGGVLLVRIPVAGSFAHREYGSHWVQLDAPRHTVILSERGLKLLAERTGFTVREVRYDSTGFQFWGSEQYRRDIPLRDPMSHDVNPGRTFTKREIAGYERRAAELNARGEGDQAAFLLVRR